MCVTRLNYAGRKKPKCGGICEGKSEMLKRNAVRRRWTRGGRGRGGSGRKRRKLGTEMRKEIV